MKKDDFRYRAMLRLSLSNSECDTQTKTMIRELYEEVGSEEIYSSIEKAKFTPFVADLLWRLGYDDFDWKGIREEFAERNRNIIRELDAFFALLDENQIKNVVVVENFGAFLASGAEQIWRFASGDVNLYGDIAQKDALCAVAQLMGYQIKDICIGKKVMATVLKLGSIDLEIAWYPTTRVKIPPLNCKEAIVDWNSTVCFHNTHIRLPERNVLAYQCMMHISVHSYCRKPDIRLYIDIQNCLMAGSIDWEQIIRWARRDKLCNRIATVGFLSKELLDCEIPTQILKLSQGTQHDRLIRYVYNPEEKSLIPRERSLDALWIELYSDDKGIFNGLYQLLFPNTQWLKECFGGSILRAYMLYIKGLL